MPRYVLKDDGYPTFKKIMNGRKWIGRVCKTEKGHFLGLIGPTTFKHPTERGAFNGVVAKHCGFDDVADMNDHNRIVRAGNQRKKAEARHIVQAMFSGNFEPFGDFLAQTDKEDQ